MPTLPTINVSALLIEGGDETAKNQCREAIAEALVSPGFFYVSGSSVNINACLSVAQEFFSLPLHEKRSIAMHEYRGFSEMDSEVTLGAPDHHECIDIFKEHDDPSLPFTGRNQWPEQLPSLRKETMSALEGLCRVAHVVVESIAIVLGVKDEMLPMFTPGFYVLRYLHYPPQAQTGDGPGIGTGAHTDYGCVTLVASHESGLQVQLADGTWIEPAPQPDTFICNIGDALSAWTAGRCRATPHRVIASCERHSLAFFFDPNLSATVRPLLTLDNEAVPSTFAPFS
ncbi:MAG: hypothetical protein K2X36_11990, partial [Microbacteriaceae bacterium]|nr:hypothetical protein [Microbacteriaceae bacterium]